MRSQYFLLKDEHSGCRTEHDDGGGQNDEPSHCRNLAAPPSACYLTPRSNASSRKRRKQAIDYYRSIKGAHWVDRCSSGGADRYRDDISAPKRRARL